MYAIGHILKEIREENGYPLQEVQQKVDIDLTQLSKIENGKRLPTTEQLIKLANEYPEIAVETLQVAEAKVRYGEQYLPMFQNTIHQNVNTFVDIFAGTASVSNCAIQKYNRVIINDILHSNNIIYKGFFEAGKWNESKLNNIVTEYNTLNPEMIEENYFSANFGGKFYEYNVAKIIGYIRQDIEESSFFTVYCLYLGATFKSTLSNLCLLLFIIV
ncbi:MAG: helix-turn-helix domain-containing protein [Tannerella sp.]|jgi:adenine-specific DNA-methyltransferase|nr:helix-turn-helix domain-containing protein [Tannerella sp.]